MVLLTQRMSWQVPGPGTVFILKLVATPFFGWDHWDPNLQDTVPTNYLYYNLQCAVCAAVLIYFQRFRFCLLTLLTSFFAQYSVHHLLPKFKLTRRSDGIESNKLLLTSMPPLLLYLNGTWPTNLPLIWHYKVVYGWVTVILLIISSTIPCEKYCNNKEQFLDVLQLIWSLRKHAKWEGKQHKLGRKVQQR